MEIFWYVTFNVSSQEEMETRIKLVQDTSDRLKIQVKRRID